MSIYLLFITTNLLLFGTCFFTYADEFPTFTSNYNRELQNVDGNGSDDDVESGDVQGVRYEDIDWSWYRDDMPPPVMLLQKGCSHSTWVTNTTMALLNHFGIKTYSEEYEILKPQKNRFFTKEKGMSQAIVDFYRNSQNAIPGAWWVFKGSRAHITSDVAKTLQRLNTKVINVYRSNALDKLTCNIRDCFKGGQGKDYVGYAVDLYGNPSQLCFQRRFSNTTTNKAFINIKLLSKSLEQGYHGGAFQESFLKGLKFMKFPTLKTEDLTLYEYGGFYGMRVSIKSWCYVLLSIGVKHKHMAKTVREWLQNNGYGTRELQSQRETIFNFDDVKLEVSHIRQGYFSHMIRDVIDKTKLGKKFINSL